MIDMNSTVLPFTKNPTVLDTFFDSEIVAVAVSLIMAKIDSLA
jgi:hypothetical protein